MKHISITSAAIALVLAGTAALVAQADSAELRYPVEAQQAAIFYGTNIELSDSLTRKIDSELVLLRNSGFEQLTNLIFSLPWKSGELIIEVDSSTVDKFLLRKHEQWRFLAEQYDLSAKEVDTRYTYNDSSRRLLIRSSKQTNSYLLAQKLVGVEHINAVKTSEPQDGWFFSNDNLWARSWFDNKAYYYFMTDACPEVYFRYDYFEVANDVAKCLGTHVECSDSVWYSSVLTPEEKDRRRQAFIDSAKAARPPWMDTARSELRKIFQFAHGNQFRWIRDTVTK